MRNSRHAALSERAAPGAKGQAPESAKMAQWRIRQTRDNPVLAAFGFPIKRRAPSFPPAPPPPAAARHRPPHLPLNEHHGLEGPELNRPGNTSGGRIMVVAQHVLEPSELNRSAIRAAQHRLTRLGVE